MAQEQAARNFYDFMYGKYLLKDLFDITLQDGDYLERAYNIWREIGNIATAIHAFEFEIDETREVQLPCNTEFVEAVSEGEHWVDRFGEHYHLFHADWNIDPNKFLADAIIRNPNKIRLDAQQSYLHPDGEYIPYELRGTIGNLSLYFDEKFVGHRGVCIFRGVCVDDEGNPLLNRKEAEAIAYKLAFIDTQKKSFMRDPASVQLLPYIKPESERKMAAAKIPEYISQNQWNRVLSTMTRHDRKVFWSSYKLAQ